MLEHPQRASAAARPAWDRIDTVLLDMDGTLLDLDFDNYFWLQLVPERFALQHGLPLEEARAALAPRFAAKQGTLDWYCTDYWSRELALDIAGLKHELRNRVRFLPGAEAFLRALRVRGVRSILVTNAHFDSLRIKARQTALAKFLDVMVSSHQYGAPKEHATFWDRLHAEHPFDLQRTLFIDDSLAVLRAARAYGIGQVFAVARPDSTQPARVVTEFPAIAGVAELLPTLDADGEGESVAS
jgi:putative hydrolase of the HAD superfamily